MSGRFLSSKFLFRHWILFVVALMIGSVVFDRQAFSAEAGELSKANRLTFRRVFVPADAPESWPIGTERYLPVRQTEFLRLLKQATDSSSDPAARLFSAVYRAELQDNGLLIGKAQQKIVLLGEQPRLLALEPMGAAIASATWHRSPTEPALLGNWNQAANANQALAVWVAQSGTLLFDWQQGPHATKPSRQEYLLAFPPAVPTHFELVLPLKFTPTVDRGTITPSQVRKNGTRLWLAQLASTGTTRLTLHRSPQTKTAAPLPRASQSTAYRLHATGLDFETTVLLDTRQETPSSLRLALKGSARITEATVDGKAVRWHLSESEKNVLVLPLPSQSSPWREITLRGAAPLETDKLWRLPALRPLDVFWTSGTTSLFVSPELRLQSLHPQKASLQHIVGITEKEGAGEAYRLQPWSEVASLTVVVGRQHRRIASRLVHLLDLGLNETTGQTVALLSTTGKPTFQIEADVARHWTIESIETDPSSHLGSWRVEGREARGQRLEASLTSLLQIQLNHPLQAGQPLRLRINGRWTSKAALLPARLDCLPLLRFRGIEIQRQLLALQTTNRGPIKLPDILERARIGLDQLEPHENALLAQLAEGPVLDLTDLSGSTLVETISQPPQYEADVHANLLVLPESFQHRLRFDVRPTRGAVSSLVVQFQQRLPESIEWKLAGQDRSVAVEEISAAQDSTTHSSPQVSYRIRLPDAQEKSFQIVASYESEGETSAQSAALTLPEATNWEGWIELRGPWEGVRVDDNGSLPIGPTITSSTLPTNAMPLLGRYRMKSPLHLPSQRTPTVHRVALARDANNAVAWLADYTTLLESKGGSVHVASYSLENRGASDVEIILPTGANLQTAWLNQTHVQPSPVAGKEQAYRFHFSNRDPYPSITVRYTLEGPPLGTQSTVEPSMPSCSFKVRQARWTLWTSQQYAIQEQEDRNNGDRLRWFSRLFGPLAHSSSQRVFRPFSTRHWKDLWSTPIENHRSRRAAQRLEKKLADRLAAKPLQSWGTMLLEVLDDLELSETVLVDQIALAAQGIRANTNAGLLTPERKPTETTGEQANRFSWSDVALVASPGTITWTTADRVAQWRNHLHRIGDSAVYRTESGGWLASQLKQFERNHSDEIVSAKSWATSSEVRRSDWSLPNAPSLAALGWRARTFEFVDARPAVVVSRIASHRALRYAVWLLATVLGASWLGRHPGWLAVMTSFWAALCLIVAPASIALPQAVFLGTLTAIGLRIIWKTLARTKNSAPPSAAFFVILLALCAEQNKTALAEESQPLAAPRQVFYPIDALGNSQGEDVFVSEEFLRKLNPPRHKSSYDGATSVLLQAKYQGSLPANLQSGKAPAWSMTLVAKSFVPGCRWRLPVHRDDAQWLDDNHLLNGAPLRLQWDQDGRGCELVLPQPGTHLLELRFLPRLKTTASKAELKLDIPSLPGALLDLTVPATLKNVQVASAGPLQASDDLLRFRTQLAATKALQITWDLSGTIAQEPLAGSVEQMSWLHVNRSSARLDVRFRIDSNGNVPRSLQLKKPPHLTLLPFAEGSPVESFELMPGNPTVVQLKLRPALEGPLDVLLQFQLERSTSVGNIAYPKVGLVGGMPTRNWFAVSVASGLSYKVRGSNKFRPIVAKEFALQFSSQRQPPQTQPLFAYSVDDLSHNWSLRVWPDPSSFSAQQSLRIDAHQEGVRIHYEAFVDQIAGTCLIHRLKVPNSLRVQKVSVSEGASGDTLPTRWIRSGPEQLVLFCGRPVSGPHTIRLQAIAEVSEDRTVPLPTISLLGAPRDEVRLDLYRRPEVLLTWKNPSHKRPDTRRAGFPSRQDAHLLVGRYVLRPEESTGQELLQIAGNYPRLKATTITTLERQDVHLRATFAVRVSVRQGVVDRLRLAVPATWREPWKVLPVGSGVIGKTRKTADGHFVEVLLTKPLGVGQTLDLRIAGALQLTNNQHLEVPDIRLIDAIAEERYVLLPNKFDSRPIAWLLQGLKHQKLPDELHGMLKSDTNQLSLRVVSEYFSASEQLQENQLRRASLRHLAVRGIVDRSDVWTGTAELVLQPGMATHCTLQLPAHSELIQLWVAGQPVRREKIATESDAPRRWRIPLGPIYLPQRITVSYSTRLASLGGRITLAPPQLLIGDRTLPTPPTSWQIQPVGGALPVKALLGQSIRPEAFSRALLTARQEALTDAIPLALQLHPQESRPWFHAWQNHLQQISAEVHAEGGSSQNSSSEEERFRKLWSTLAEHLEENLAPAAHTNWAPPELPPGTTPALANRKLFFLSGRSGQIQLQRGVSAWRATGRLLLALSIACAGIVLGSRLKKRPQWRDLLRRQPHATTMAVGFFWWLLLHPSLLGLLVAVAAGTDWARRRILSRRALRPGSPAGTSDVSTSLAEAQR